jgi:Cyclophilin type peptidyl-prolyl cis-trans isomerase/CLD
LESRKLNGLFNEALCPFMVETNLFKMNSIKYILLNIFLLTTLLACGQKDQVIKIHRPYGIYADFNTNKGSISVLLYYKQAPMTVANFIGLAEGTLTNATYPLGIPFYKGSIWHRVVKGHVVQGDTTHSITIVREGPEAEKFVVNNEKSW